MCTESTVETHGPPALETLGAPLKRDGRSLSKVDIVTALMTAAVLVPAWATIVLPLSVVYQLGKAATRPLFPKTESVPMQTDSGVLVKASDRIPRSERKLDLVLLGATGFTGSLGVRYMARTYGVGKTVQWAIAGRSQAKLDKLKADLAAETGNDELLKLETILVDTQDPTTLPALVRNTRAVATTAGPFQLYGNLVVEFCAKYGTHYVDITGETNWVMTMMLKWEEVAQATGAKIISLCGHDSVPWDLTVMKMAESLQKECGDTLESVTCWNQSEGQVSGGTIATMSLAFEGKSVDVPTHQNTDATLKLPDGTISRRSGAKLGPWFRLSKPVAQSNKASVYTSPALMAPVNFEVVRRSNALSPQGSSTLLYTEFNVCPNFQTAFCNSFQFLFFVTAMSNPLTRSLLRRYALPKPGEGPSQDFMDQQAFLLVTGEGVGKNRNLVQTSFYFPKDPGYTETARMLLESGLCLALEDASVPAKRGGFWTPASGLGNVLLERLCRTGSYFASQVTPAEKRLR